MGEGTSRELPTFFFIISLVQYGKFHSICVACGFHITIIYDHSKPKTQQLLFESPSIIMTIRPWLPKQPNRTKFIIGVVEQSQSRLWALAFFAAGLASWPRWFVRNRAELTKLEDQGGNCLLRQSHHWTLISVG